MSAGQHTCWCCHLTKHLRDVLTRIAFITKVFNTSMCSFVWYNLIPTWIFSTDFTKNLESKISRKLVHGEESCTMQVDGQTDEHDEDHINYLKDNAPNCLFWFIGTPAVDCQCVWCWDCAACWLATANAGAVCRLATVCHLATDICGTMSVTSRVSVDA
jgi:hypothetical protein